MRVSMKSNQAVFDILAGKGRELRMDHARLHFTLIEGETIEEMEEHLRKLFPQSDIKLAKDE